MAKPPVVVTDADKSEFLEKDLYNTLRNLFEGAIAWDAWKQNKGTCRHQGVLGMYTAFMEARALYDFFHNRTTNNDQDNALADHFTRNSKWKADKSDVYTRYMARKQAVNKRMFHLVYGRSGKSGKTKKSGQLNEQVLNVAVDLLDVTVKFIAKIDDPSFRKLAAKALLDALAEAKKASDDYGISSPLSAGKPIDDTVEFLNRVLA